MGDSTTEDWATAALKALFWLIFMNHTTVNSCTAACLACLIECESCITHCIALNDATQQKCIALCRDCADLCALCARFEARGSAYRGAICKLCAEICNACAAECGKHTTHECCQKCAAACRDCATACAAWCFAFNVSIGYASNSMPDGWISTGQYTTYHHTQGNLLYNFDILDGLYATLAEPYDEKMIFVMQSDDLDQSYFLQELENLHCRSISKYW